MSGRRAFRLLVVSLAVALLAAGCAEDGDGKVYETLAHEASLHEAIARRVAEGIGAFAELPSATPDVIAAAHEAKAAIQRPLQQEVERWQASVAAARQVRDDRSAEVDALVASLTLSRVRERRLGRPNNSLYTSNRGRYRWKTCGADGCGASCGSCDADELCFDGFCRCIPQCGEKQCGDDGCGGSCGLCGGNSPCEDGECRAVPQPRVDVPGCFAVCGDDDDASFSAFDPDVARNIVQARYPTTSPSPSSPTRVEVDRAANRGEPLGSDRLERWIAALDADIELQAGRVAAAGEVQARIDAAAARVDTLTEQVATSLQGTKDARTAVRDALKAAAQSRGDAQLAAAVGTAKDAVSSADAALKERRAELVAAKKEVAALRAGERRAREDGVEARDIGVRLGRERALFVEKVSGLAAARQALTAAETALASAEREASQQIERLQAAAAPQLEAARARVRTLEEPVFTAAELPDDVDGDPRAPENARYLSSGAGSRSDVLEERLTSYVAKAEQTLAARATAWAALSDEAKAGFPFWPQVDRALSVHIYHLHGLLASNTRLRERWAALSR